MEGSIQLFVICVNDKYARSVIMVYEDRNVVAQLVRRAERGAGFKAIVLTVDTQGWVAEKLMSKTGTHSA
ncbi:hypothetical protein LguiA_029318 [Lonicera macranthoides]